ncbi:uncharacterized protein [Diadema antillarum]|uniref:uncharacterized protein n=1 Tax=Diadema antillarum TaxID=105358 RepID=UPI003A8B8994
MAAASTLPVAMATETKDAHEKEMTPPALGKDLQDREFLFAPSVVYLNNGSYGAVPRQVFDAQQRLMREREANPEEWYRFSRLRRYKEAAECVAEFVGAKPENLVLVENVTTATNCIIKSFKFQAGDQILVSSHTYGAVLKAVNMIIDLQPGVSVVKIEIPFETTSEEIIDRHTRALEENPGIKMAMLDHITSASAIRMPLKELIALCRRHGALSVVDGAHCPGQIPLNLEEIEADFYFGNLHKWLFAARGCALFYVHPKHQSWIRTAISSHSTFAEELLERFHYIGTRDNTPYYTAATAVAFHKSLGGLEHISAYNTELVTWAADMLASAWKTKVILREESLRAPNMLLIVLPDTPKLAKYRCENGNYNLIYDLAQAGAGVAVTNEGSRLFARISAHVYNYKEEYYKLRDVVIKVLDVDV